VQDKTRHCSEDARLRYADRSFTVAGLAGPKSWNALPPRLRGLACKDSFRGHLETHFLTSILTSVLKTLALF